MQILKTIHHHGVDRNGSVPTHGLADTVNTNEPKNAQQATQGV